jgi:predicted enzyme related to lactoylglutathione lyase
MTDHPVVHFEIGCRGGEETREFFARLFGWEISGRDAGMMIDTGGDGAISGHIVELASEWGNYVTVYVQVEDLEVYLEKAGELGGKTLVPPVALPGRGRGAC